MDTVFRPIAPGRIHRWTGAGLVVARRADLRGVPHLSAAEQGVVRALPAWRQAEWLAGRLLAKRLVGVAVGAPVEEVEVLPREDGSPRVLVGGRALPSVHVSVSHTAGHVAAAVAPGPVGVDLCETASAAVVRRVAHRVFSAAEVALAGPDRADGLAGAWALKEAAVKADRSTVFGAAPRRIRILGLRPPVLGGGRRAMVWRAGDAVLALVLARPAGCPAGRHCVGAPCPAGSCLSVEPLPEEVAVGQRQRN
ncbi:4'-phosphopantetheinyl transferase family protein [Streptomyces antimicrobicus]|uniref:4'-phosphopantetheinyl transferase superfamily protein n=1 Tax=Streptomyces antimicrobicus TaxID=2883108 RepID=A0ABS8BBQ8_9ACTN|nr:4'-phosphopantetheinyl transferase superfamily protein [Streptomyces antimicrobicus]MCB5181973.1 4'-phosphopantetheinyl transferase superfamily protein [Streptomyces antimicrobicus]